MYFLAVGEKRKVRIFDLILTSFILIPFSLLSGFYVFSILLDTIQKPPERPGWEWHVYFAALVLTQIVSLVVFILSIFLIIYVVVQSG